jgi:hypothetical protein
MGIEPWSAVDVDAAGEQPLPSGAASNSAVIRLPPALPNIVA